MELSALFQTFTYMHESQIATCLKKQMLSELIATQRVYYLM